MAAVQFFLPYDIAIKPTNVGAPGAKLYVFAPSSTTLRPVYATSALTTQLSNPVVADGAGKFPPIYLDNSLTYKIVINDRNGALLYSRDLYIPGSAPDSASLAPYQAAAAASAVTAGSSATSATASATSATASAASATAVLTRVIKAPVGETIGDLPIAANRASKYLAFDAAGEPTPAAGTDGGADGTLRTDLAASSGSTLILHKIAGAGTFARTLRQWAAIGGFDNASIFNWVDSSDDTAIIAETSVANHSAAGQAALDANAKRLWLPKGLFNISNLRARSGSAIVGGGPGVATLKALANQLPHVPIIRNYTDNPANAAARDTDITISGLMLNGNKANNATQDQWGHGIETYAVDGLTISNVRVLNPHGDGVSLGYSSADQGVGCSNVSLNVHITDADRQGVSIICAENVTGWIITERSRYFGLDLEPDSASSFIRNINLIHTSYRDGLGTASSGGVGITCPAGSENVSLNFNIFEPNGEGVVWRDAKGLKLSGNIVRAAGNALSGLAGGTIASSVSFDVSVDTCGGRALTTNEAVGGTYTGKVTSKNSGTVSDASASFAGGPINGELNLTLANSGQGVTFNGTTGNLVLRDLSVTGHTGHNIWFINNASGMRVCGFKGTGSSFGGAVVEAAGSDNNRVTDAIITGSYGSGPISLSGPNSMVCPSASPGITAHAGGGKASATVLRSVFNVVSTVATAANSVLLPAAQLGDRITVKNAGANAMQVFGQGTDTINGVATGTGISQAAGTTVIYFAVAAGQWQT